MMINLMYKFSKKGWIPLYNNVHPHIRSTNVFASQHAFPKTQWLSQGLKDSPSLDSNANLYDTDTLDIMSWNNYYK